MDDPIDPFADLLPKRSHDVKWEIRTTTVCCPLCCEGQPHNMLVIVDGDYQCPECRFVFGMPPIGGHV